MCHYRTYSIMNLALRRIWQIIAAERNLAEMAVKNYANPRINQIANGDEPIHNWYRFVLSYPPHVVREYMDKLEVGAGSVLLDPFCGTGTTIVEAKKHGVKAIGVEAHPMTAFASATKLDWDVDAVELGSIAEAVAESSLRILRNTRVRRRLGDEQSSLILRDSISELPLHKTLVLLDTIKKSTSQFDRQMELALAKVLVYSASNLHFGPEVGVTRTKKDDYPVVEKWLETVMTMCSDLEHVQQETGAALDSSYVLHADSRGLGRWAGSESVTHVICSPPYPNEKDYTRTTRLESVVLGHIRNKEQLRQVKKGLVRSNTRTIYKGDVDAARVSHIPSIMELAAEIEATRLELGKTSGFERQYHKVVTNYFGGMLVHLEEMKGLLEPGAKLAYVVGDQASFFRVMIRTGTLLAEVAESVGYRVLGIDLFRTRIATATRQQIREEVLLLEWPGE